MRFANSCAVGGRAARIGVQHDVARRRVQLHVGGEHRPVGGERAAVDLEDQRVLLRWIEIRRQRRATRRSARWSNDEVTASGRTSARVLSANSPALSCVSRRVLPRRVDRDVRRALRRAAREGDRAVVRHRELATRVGTVEAAAAQALGHRREAAVEVDPRDFRHRPVVVAHVEAAAVRRPVRLVDRAVEAARERSRRCCRRGPSRRAPRSDSS